MASDIRFYDRQGPYFCFTNFAPDYPVKLDGQIWPSTEHYYQASKFSDARTKSEIRNSPSPRVALDCARKYEFLMNPGWETCKCDMMRKAVTGKFRQHSTLAEKLLATGERTLIEASKSDWFWGEGEDGGGRNELGMILMELREEMRHERELLHLDELRRAEGRRHDERGRILHEIRVRNEARGQEPRPHRYYASVEASSSPTFEEFWRREHGRLPIPRSGSLADIAGRNNLSPLEEAETYRRTVRDRGGRHQSSSRSTADDAHSAHPRRAHSVDAPRHRPSSPSPSKHAACGPIPPPKPSFTPLSASPLPIATATTQPLHQATPSRFPNPCSPIKASHLSSTSFTSTTPFPSVTTRTSDLYFPDDLHKDNVSSLLARNSLGHRGRESSPRF